MDASSVAESVAMMFAVGVPERDVTCEKSERRSHTSAVPVVAVAMRFAISPTCPENEYASTVGVPEYGAVWVSPHVMLPRISVEVSVPGLVSA
jgi:hypothetical protein